MPEQAALESWDCKPSRRRLGLGKHKEYPAVSKSEYEPSVAGVIADAQLSGGRSRLLLSLKGRG